MPSNTVTADTLPAVHPLALIIPAAIAVVFFAPFLAGATFLSDDYLLVSFLDPETGAVRWPEIFSDFGESWFLSHAYWRPLVSLSYGMNIVLLGFSPISLYAVNLLLHLVLVVATAGLCYRLGSKERPLLAGLLGGLFVALHPVSPEPVLWIAARTTGLEVSLRMCAVVAFAAYLRSRRKTTYGLVFVFSALALASKESAVVLPVYLLFVDLLDSPRRAARERLLLHSPLFALWLLYAVVRLSVLGRVLGMPVAHVGAEDVTTVFGQKLAMLLAPDLWAGLGWVLVAAATAMLAWPRVETLAPLLGLGAVALVVSLAPTYNVPLGEGTVGVRVLYGSLPVLAVLACRCLLAGREGPGVNKRLRELVAVLLVASGLPAMFSHVASYRQAWQTMRKAEAQIAEAGMAASPRRPLGLVRVPPCRAVPGPVNPQTYFAFGRHPFTARPIAIAGLGCLISPPPFSVELINDPRPVHAFLGAGCTVAAWSESAGRMRLLRGDSAASEASPGRLVAETGVVTFEPPRPLATIEHIRIRASGNATGGGIPELHVHFGGGVREGAEKIFHVDVSRNVPLLQEILAGRELPSFKVELQGGRILGVDVSDRLPRLELGRRLDGLGVGILKLDTVLVAPPLQGPAPMRIVLIGESTGFTWTVEPGAPVSIPLDTLDVMSALERRLEAKRYHYYFQTAAPQGSPGSARSDLDWFTLER